MRKFKNATETLDALEEELLKMKKEGKRLRVEFVPDAFVVALYRLAETQIALAGESWFGDPLEENERQRERLVRHADLEMWITEQPE